MKVTKKSMLYQILSYGIVVCMAALLAVDYYIFIIENQFAPAGLNGIATIWRISARAGGSRRDWMRGVLTPSTVVSAAGQAGHPSGSPGTAG